MKLFSGRVVSVWLAQGRNHNAGARTRRRCHSAGSPTQQDQGQRSCTYPTYTGVTHLGGVGFAAFGSERTNCETKESTSDVSGPAILAPSPLPLCRLRPVEPKILQLGSSRRHQCASSVFAHTRDFARRRPHPFLPAPQRRVQRPSVKTLLKDLAPTPVLPPRPTTLDAQGGRSLVVLVRSLRPLRRPYGRPPEQKRSQTNLFRVTLSLRRG